VLQQDENITIKRNQPFALLHYAKTLKEKDLQPIAYESRRLSPTQISLLRTRKGNISHCPFTQALARIH
jgi:hypothetical protein